MTAATCSCSRWPAGCTATPGTSGSCSTCAAGCTRAEGTIAGAVHVRAVASAPVSSGELAGQLSLLDMLVSA